jgi:bifunctional polynucleotide phosphatase/kinase
MLPKLAFTGFAARYREPTLEEGFVDITTVDFKVRLITNAPRKY